VAEISFKPLQVVEGGIVRSAARAEGFCKRFFEIRYQACLAAGRRSSQNATLPHA